MEQKLYEQFRKQFPSMDKLVHQEELILFLEKLGDFKFSREIFKELTDFLTRNDKALTPNNFFESYVLAYKLLQKKEKIVLQQKEYNDQIIQNLSEQKNLAYLEVQDIQTNTHKSKLFHFELSLDTTFKLKIIDFLKGCRRIYISQTAMETQTQISVFMINENGQNEDIQVINLPFYSYESFNIRFKNDIKLTLGLKSEKIEGDDRQQIFQEIKEQQQELQAVADFCSDQKRILEKPFQKIFLLQNSNVFDVSKMECSPLMKQTSFLAGSIFFVSLLLNFYRCCFVDILIAISFISNIYIWRIYNMFMMIKFVSIIGASVIFDLIWIFIQIIHFSNQLTWAGKTIRVLYIILSLAQVSQKLFFSFLLYQFNKQSKQENILQLEQDYSVYEVDQEDYLVLATQSPNKDKPKTKDKNISEMDL